MDDSFEPIGNKHACRISVLYHIELALALWHALSLLTFITMTSKFYHLIFLSHRETNTMRGFSIIENP